jgi:hypothetical protein
MEDLRREQMCDRTELLLFDILQTQKEILQEIKSINGQGPDIYEESSRETENNSGEEEEKPVSAESDQSEIIKSERKKPSSKSKKHKTVVKKGRAAK